MVWTCAAATISSASSHVARTRPPLPALRVVAAACVLVVGDGRPGLDRIAVVRGLGRAVHLEQHAAHVRVAHARRRVGVPAERRAARAAAGLVLRGVRTHRRVVGLLGLPGDDPVLDVDLPRAGARCSSRRASSARSCRATSGPGRRRRPRDRPPRARRGGRVRRRDRGEERAGRDESVDDRVVDARRGVHVTAPRVGVRRAPESARGPGAGRVGSGGRRTGRP